VLPFPFFYFWKQKCVSFVVETETCFCYHGLCLETESCFHFDFNHSKTLSCSLILIVIFYPVISYFVSGVTAGKLFWSRSHIDHDVWFTILVCLDYGRGILGGGDFGFGSVGHVILNRGDIAILGDSYWSWGLVLQVLAREKNLKESICFKLTNKCWQTYSENYGKS
jgi:hypothetical protein